MGFHRGVRGNPRQYWLKAENGKVSIFHEEQKLASAVSRTKIAAMLNLKDETRVSKHLSALEEMGLIKRRRTGRETIFILGEWFDISEKKDKSKRKEWFYIEQKFGGTSSSSDDNSGDGDSPQDGDDNGSTSDVAENTTSDVSPRDARQMWRNEPHNNIEGNTENNTTTVNGSKNPINDLPLLEIDEGKVRDTANHIGQKLGISDSHSQKFHLSVAWRIPRNIIERHLDDILETGANNPASLFTHRMKEVALKNLAKDKIKSSQELAQNMSIEQGKNEA